MSKRSKSSSSKKLTHSTFAGAVFAALFAAGSLFASPAHAQPKDDGGDAASATGDSSKKVKNYDFTGDEIDGDLIKPDGDFIDARNIASHGNLIRIRTDFIREILKSAEDL